MNKTININIGGTFFHIDEEAFDELQHYLVILKKSFYETQGSEEIIGDIEFRIAELFNERLTESRKVVNRIDVEQVIEIMGRPEEFYEELDEDMPFSETREKQESKFDQKRTESTSESKSKNKNSDKELFRDPETGIIGGVLAGFGHYFGLDKTWVRIIWLLLSLLTIGTFILLYLVLWIIVPAPKTTSDRLKMKGERINVTNIERTIRKEFENLEKEVGEFSKKVKETDFKQMGDNVKKGAQTFSNKTQPIVKNFFRLIAKIIGIFILIKTSMAAIVLLFGWFCVAILGLNDLFFFEDFGMLNQTDLPLWLAATLAFCIMIIPVILYMILGLKLTFLSSKRSYSTLGLSLFGAWIFLILVAVFFGFQQSIGYQSTGSRTVTQTLEIPEGKMLTVKMNPEFIYEDQIDSRTGFDLLSLDNQDPMILNTNVTVRLKGSTVDNSTIKVKRIAQGYDIESAKSRATNIEYNYSIDSNNIVLNDYYIHDFDDKVRGQEVEVTLFLKEGIPFKFDPNIRGSLRTRLDYKEDFNWREFYRHSWIIQNEELICLDCKVDPVQEEVSEIEEKGTLSSDSLGEDYDF